MNHSQEMAQLIQQYTLDTKGRNVPIPRILAQPWHIVCGWYFDALAHYNLDRHCMSLEEVKEPVEGQWAFVRDGKTRFMWVYRGAWEYVQECPDSIYKEG